MNPTPRPSKSRRSWNILFQTVSGASRSFFLIILTLHAQATPPVTITPSPATVRVRWTPSLDSVNFFQISTDLRDWKYLPEAISGTDTTRVLDFPTSGGSKFFRAIKRPYSGLNATNEDFDGDGLVTRDELLLFRTDPLAPDSDSDGQSDGAEDSDQDGIPDAVEFLADLDPMPLGKAEDFEYIASFI